MKHNVVKIFKGGISEWNACTVITQSIHFSLNVQYSSARKKEAGSSSETSVLFNNFEGLLYLLGFTIIQRYFKWTCFVLSNDVEKTINWYQI
jgi:hypothetical protein